jgi:hypothetical protein
LIIPNEYRRGGVVVMLKSDLWNKIHNIRIEKDQVWFSLSSIPNTVIGAIYCAPRDSPYYDPAAMAIMQEQCLKKYQHTIIIGDLNARVAKLQELNNNELNLRYSQNPDTTTNENGKELLSFCKTHNIVPVNHMKHHNVTCEGGYTYKQKNNWISQLDWALCSINMLSHIKKFRIIQDQNLPTDHAAIALSLTNLLCPAAHIRNCAEQLGAYTFLQQTRARCIKPPIPFLRVNQQHFRNKLPSLQELSNITEGTNIEEICTKVADIMYNKRNPKETNMSKDQLANECNTTMEQHNIIARSKGNMDCNKLER